MSLAKRVDLLIHLSLAIAMSLAATSLAQGRYSPRAIDKPDIPDDQVLIAATLTEKILADELYLQTAAENCTPLESRRVCTGEDEDSVRSAYCSVMSRLEDTDIKYADGRDAIRDLLIMDASYRLRLRSRCLPFWGGITTRSPGIPNVALQEMEDLLATLQVLSEEIRTNQRLSADHLAQAALEQAVIAGADTQREMARIHKRRARSSQQVATRNQDGMRERIVAMDSDDVEMGGNINELKELQAKAEAAVLEALIGAFGQSLGLPQELQGAPEGSSLDVAWASVSDGIPAAGSRVHPLLYDDLEAYQSDGRALARRFWDPVGSGGRTENNWEVVEAEADAFRKALFHRLAKLGVVIFEQAGDYLPKGHEPGRWQREWRQVILASKPVWALLGVAELGNGSSAESLSGAVEALPEYALLSETIKEAVIGVLMDQGGAAGRLRGTLMITLGHSFLEQTSRLEDLAGLRGQVLWNTVNRIYQFVNGAYVAMLKDPEMGALDRRIILNAIFKTNNGILPMLLEEQSSTYGRSETHLLKDILKGYSPRFILLHGFSHAQ